MNLSRSLRKSALLLCGAFLVLSTRDASAVAPYRYPVYKMRNQPLKGGYSWKAKKLQPDHWDRVSSNRVSPGGGPFVPYSRPQKSNRVSR